MLGDIIDRGSFGTVYCGSYRGMVIAAKVLQVSGSDMKMMSREVEMLK